MYRDSKGGKFDVPAYDIDVVCTCGCGDCFNAGFATGALDGDDIDEGRLDQPPSSVTIPALVFAFDGFYLKEGDVLETRIGGPGGWTHEHRETVEASKASFMRFSGRKAPSGGFAPGTYEASLEVSRAGKGVIARIERTVELQ